MASTSKNWTGSNSWVSCRLVVTSTPNTTGNYSDVTATLYGARNDGGTSYNDSSSNFWIKINGTKTSRTSGCTVSGTGWTQVHKQTTRVYHNDDGTKTISISAGGGITDTTFQMGSSSVSLTLDKIARKSTLTASNGTLGTAQTLTINKQNSSFTDTVTYKCGNASGTIVTKTTSTSVSWTPPLDLASQNTAGTTVSVTFTIETFNGSTSLGTNTKTITCTIPETIIPTVEFIESDTTGYATKYGAYVQGKSILQVTITASGVYGSTISKYNTTVDGKTFTSDSFTVEPIQNNGELAIVVTVTDSRGRKATAQTTITVLQYESPKITAISVKRCEEDGTSSSSGAYLAVQFDASITVLNNGNSATYKVQYKETANSQYTETTLTDFDGVYSVTDGMFIFTAEKSSSYDIVLIVTDDFGSVQKIIIGPSIKKLFSALRKGLGFAFGKVAELENTLEIAFKTKHTGGLIYPVLPSGTDLDTVLTLNSYVLTSDKTYTNAPVSGVNAVLDVVGEEGNFLIQQLKIASKDDEVAYERTWDVDGWGEWMIPPKPPAFLGKGTDLNTLTEPRVYIGETTSTGEYLNTPSLLSSETSFTLEVFKAGQNGQIYQRLTACSKLYTQTFERHYYGNSWGDWNKTIDFGDNVLWSGGYHMVDTHTATLSQPITAQAHGIVLIFSYFSNNTAQDWDFVHFFVPKYMASVWHGKGSDFIMFNSTFGQACGKYLYIRDTTITGASNNNTSGTGSVGVKYNNAQYVLRYVIGV